MTTILAFAFEPEMYSVPSCGYGGAGSSAFSCGNQYSGVSSGRYDSSREYNLERIVVSDSIERRSDNVVPIYSRVPYTAGLYFSNRFAPQEFLADAFIDLSVPQRFVGSAKEIQPFVEEAFRAVTGNDLPGDVMIHVCDLDSLKSVHVGRWSDGIQGFCFNRNGFGVSDIFVKKDRLDRVMLTLGHELGHALTPPLSNDVDEEAKAFAFSIAWMEAIHEKNIAGIANSVNPRPAENGLHDVAFGFVARMIRQGSAALDVFKSLVKRSLSINDVVEQVVR